MNLLRFSPVLAAALLLGACVSVPSGPSVMVLPGTGKSFDQFRADDRDCRQFAYSQVGGTDANQVASESAVKSAAVGTVIGAAAGAAIGGRSGAAVGAGGGVLGGSAAGADAARPFAQRRPRRLAPPIVPGLVPKRPQGSRSG